ncbi:MAG: hypothetical protein DHS20C16_24140 [Phycisphaerae bacterium]|nr:MAG: hypothetical protein DHS20C16_24140 [Phycisphaerae bacterium]
MSYITDADIERRLGSADFVQLTDDAGSGAADLDVVAEAREGAVGEVNSYLARRFRVPIDVGVHAELASILATVTLDVVAHRLHSRRPPIPTEVAARYESTVSWLAKVATGDVSLPSEGMLAGADASGVIAKATGNQAVLSRDELAGL